VNNRAKDLERRFDLIDEALDGLSNHDRFGLLGGMVGFILQQYMRSAENQGGEGQQPPTGQGLPAGEAE
jgi:hypothetical protein